MSESVSRLRKGEMGKSGGMGWDGERHGVRGKGGREKKRCWEKRYLAEGEIWELGPVFVGCDPD